MMNAGLLRSSTCVSIRRLSTYQQKQLLLRLVCPCASRRFFSSQTHKKPPPSQLKNQSDGNAGSTVGRIRRLDGSFVRTPSPAANSISSSATSSAVVLDEVTKKEMLLALANENEDGRTWLRYKDVIFALRYSSRICDWESGLSCLRRLSRPWHTDIKESLKSFLRVAPAPIALEAIQLWSSVGKGKMQSVRKYPFVDAELLEEGIKSAAKSGRWQLAQKLLLASFEEGLQPSDEAYCQVLRVCAGENQWQTVVSIYERMRGIKGFEPTQVKPVIIKLVQAYSCIGRSTAGVNLFNEFFQHIDIDKTKAYSFYTAAVTNFVRMEQWDAAASIIDCAHRYGTQFFAMRDKFWERAILALIKAGRGPQAVVDLIKTEVQNTTSHKSRGLILTAALEALLTIEGGPQHARVLLELLDLDSKLVNDLLILLVNRVINPKDPTPLESFPSVGTSIYHSRPSIVEAVNPFALSLLGQELSRSMGTSLRPQTWAKFIQLARYCSLPPEHALRCLEEAEKVGVKLREWDYKMVIETLGIAGDWKGAVELLEEMNSMQGRGGVKAGNKSYAAAIHACARVEELEGATRLFAEMEAKGLLGSDRASLEVYRSLIHVMTKLGLWEQPLALLESIKGPFVADVGIYWQVMEACSRAGEWQACLSILKKVKQQIGGRSGSSSRDAATETGLYNMALAACRKQGAWEALGNLVQQMEEKGLMNAESYAETLEAMHRNQILQPGEALAIVRKMIEENASSLRIYHKALAALNTCEQWSDALMIFDQMMQKREVVPDIGCFRAVMRSCHSLNDWQTCLRILRQASEYHPQPDPVLYTLAFDTILRHQKGSVEARQQTKNLIKAMVHAKVGGDEEELSRIQRMKETRFWLTSALNICRASGEWEAMGWLLDEALKRWNRRLLTKLFDHQSVDKANVAAREAGQEVLARRLKELEEGGGSGGGGRGGALSLSDGGDGVVKVMAAGDEKGTKEKEKLQFHPFVTSDDDHYHEVEEDGLHHMLLAADGRA